MLQEWHFTLSNAIIITALISLIILLIILVNNFKRNLNNITKNLDYILSNILFLEHFFLSNMVYCYFFYHSIINFKIKSWKSNLLCNYNFPFLQPINSAQDNMYYIDWYFSRQKKCFDTVSFMINTHKQNKIIN